MTIQPRQAPSQPTHSIDDNPNQATLMPSGVDAQSGQTTHPTLIYRGSSNHQFQSLLKRWFYNLPVRRKQFLGLLTSEIIIILGLAGLGSLLLIFGGRSQLKNQAKSELAVTETVYNIKINQMGFGFRGQSENRIIQEAAQTYLQSRGISAETEAELRRILANEVKIREIEFATLVGTDLKIIANANTDRSGQRFDPNGLAATVLANPRQLRTSAIIPWAELVKEEPPLPPGVVNQDALIRYVLTPVRNPETGAVIGVLIAGDIVNRKGTIVEETIRTFRNGYSAVYLRQPSGELVLATGLDHHPNEENVNVNEEVTDRKFLESAFSAGGQPVVGRMDESHGKATYTMAAKAIDGFDGKPVGVLVRGTSEEALNEILRNSLLLLSGVALTALALNTLMAQLLGQAIAHPIEQLRAVTQRFTAGDRQVRAEVISGDEVGELSAAFNQLADNVTQSETVLQAQARLKELEVEKATLLAALTTRMRQSLDQEEIFPISVQGLREALAVDRAIVYLFDDQWQGTIVSESIAPGCASTLGEQILDPCFAEGYVEKYRRGHVQATDNIYEAGLGACHLRQLEMFGVKANLVAPILVEGKLIGLLIAHHCSGSHPWQPPEVEFAKQASVQMGYALEQAKLFAQREKARLEAQALSEDQRQQKEALQMQLLNLLSEVEGASRGDLTVRAEVTVGEIGTVADFFNSIIESLRQIVTQVKRSALQVNNSLGQNEMAVRRLADDALSQAEEITRTLDSVEQMTRSIQSVSESAQQAAAVARTASTKAEIGGNAMDLTVQNILNLRETVGETAKKVKRLGESSQQISRVVALINQIAMQTNLLAINAGIEAARAGEEAQGFAVVAEEVGELAARSAAATQEIEKIVEVIQRETNQVVAAMEESTAQVVEGTHLVEDAKQSLTQIVSVSRQIDDLVQGISTATVTQVETSEAVARLMRQVALVSENTSSSSRQVSAAIRDTVAIAQDLQSSVETFEVGMEERV